MKIDQKKLERQKQIIDKVAGAVASGNKRILFMADTGFGKTFTITNVLFPRMLAKNNAATFQVLVPTTYLYQQWTLRKGTDNCEVSTWQGQYMYRGKKKVDVLVIDEFHSLVNTIAYKQVLEDFDCKFVVGMSATMDELSMANASLLGFKLVDRVTREECLANNWVAPAKEYNVCVNLTVPETREFLDIDQRYNDTVKFLDARVMDLEAGGFYRASYDVLKSIGIKRFVGYKLLDGTVMHCYEHDERAYQVNKGRIKHYKTGKNAGSPYKEYSYPNAEQVAKLRGVSVDIVMGKVSLANQLLNTRKQLFYNHPRKVAYVKAIAEMLPVHKRGFTFSLTSSMCDLLMQEVPDSVAYHNKVKPKKELEKRVLDFKEGRARVLHSIGKVEAGADFPDVDWAVNVAYYSKSMRKAQKDGRAKRMEKEGKVAIIINLYTRFHPSITTRSTLERSWLIQAQGGKAGKPNSVPSHIKWVDIDELFFELGQ